MKQSLKLRTPTPLVGVIALAITSPAIAQQGGQGYGPHMWNGGSWMFFGPMMMFIGIAVIVMIVVLLSRWLGGTGHTSSHVPPYPQRPGPAPLDILKERFARGEIDKEEFEERRHVLAE